MIDVGSADELLDFSASGTPVAECGPEGPRYECAQPGNRETGDPSKDHSC
jgi:hypothetical protein